MQLFKAEEPVDSHWTVTVVGLIRFGKKSRVIVVSSFTIVYPHQSCLIGFSYKSL